MKAIVVLVRFEKRITVAYRLTFIGRDGDRR